MPSLNEPGRQPKSIGDALAGTAGSFRRNALVLTVGTFAAQGLPLLFYPIFTRLFAPAEFGVFATVSFLATMAALIAGGAYEHAILIARTRRLAAHVAAYTLLRSAIALTILFAVSIPLARVLVPLGVDAAVGAWLPAVPLVAAALVVYNCYTEWCVRSQYFSELARVRIWQTSAIAASRLALGTLAPWIDGFVAGDAIGKTLSAARCAAMVRKRDQPYIHIHTLRRLRAAAHRYAHVARYTLPDQLVNTLGSSIHVVFLTAAFGTEELGYVSLVLSVLYVPVTVVSSAVKDVFRQRATVEYARDGTCRPTYRRLLPPIVALAIVGFGTLYVVAPTVFPLLLGSNWSVAGEYARILMPLFFWNFVSMSLGGVLVIAQRADVSLAWQVASLGLTIGSLLIGTVMMDDIVAALWCFSLTRAFVYILYMALSYHYAERPKTAATPH